MAYDAQHLYLTAHWADTREPNEGGQFGIRFDSPSTTITQAMVDAAKLPVQTFWQASGASIPTFYVLKFLRLALIGTNGHYAPGTFSFDGSYGVGVSGAAVTTPLPMQVASAATFLTNLPRGQASHGRVYLPPLAAALGQDGRWTSAQVNLRAQALASMVTSLNAALVPIPNGLPAIASVFSKGTIKNGAGLHSFITGVKIGTRADVQRRRAKSQAEVYGATSSISH